LRTAVDTVAALLRSGTPTLVCCGHGMSRTPAVVAAAIGLVRGTSPADGLAALPGPTDVTPGLWRDVVAALTAPPPESR
jgi:hypothetical protein